MALGPVGNVVFANQMTANVASVANSHNNRVDFQNMVAQASANEKDEKVIEVRPTEENQEVDADREHQRDESDRNNQRSPKQDEEPEETIDTVYKLDITV